MTNDIEVKSPFWSALDMATASVAPSSARVYEGKAYAWAQWCIDEDRTFELEPAAVLLFLGGLEVTTSTRQLYMAVLRKIAKFLAITYGGHHRSNFEALREIRVPASDYGSKRKRQSLQAEDVTRLMEYWPRGNNVEQRNRTLIAVLFTTGVRRAELVNFKWEDYVGNTLAVREGKGGKERVVTIVGNWAQPELELLWAITGQCEYIFAPLNRVKNAVDKRMSAENVNRIVGETAMMCGLEITPHDARRTIARGLLEQGAQLTDVQQQLGHAKGDTTLHYAMPLDAEERHKEFALPYLDKLP